MVVALSVGGVSGRLAVLELPFETRALGCSAVLIVGSKPLDVLPVLEAVARVGVVCKPTSQALALLLGAVGADSFRCVAM